MNVLHVFILSPQPGVEPALIQPFFFNGVESMLVLTRKAGTRLVINGNVVVTVVKVARGRVKLGIEAPSEVSVRRQEMSTLTAKYKLVR